MAKTASGHLGDQFGVYHSALKTPAINEVKCPRCDEVRTPAVIAQHLSVDHGFRKLGTDKASEVKLSM